MLSVEERNKQLAAEMALYNSRFSEPEKKGFSLNPLGYGSFGSWATSALTGQVISNLAYKEDDPLMEKWFVERGWIEFGANLVDDELELYKKIGETRDFTQQEYDTIQELRRRKSLLTRDLSYVYKKLGGDFDAPMDVKGQSMNERWGIDHSNDPDVIDFLKMLKDNPTYTLGLFTSEMIKDLPLSVLSYVGLTAKTASGASALRTAVNTLNKIEPKIMRNIAKIGTGVAASSAAGAGYEAAYTLLDQGDVKGYRVKTGAQFGAAFGVLAGLGLLRSGSNLTKATPKTKTPTPPDEIKGAASDAKELDAVTEAVTTSKERQTILNPAEELAKNPRKIFPELTERELVFTDKEKSVYHTSREMWSKDRLPDSYILVDLGTREGRAYARQNKWLGKNKNDTLKGFTGVKTVIDRNIADGMPHIVVDYNRTAKVFSRLKKNFSKHVGEGGRLRKVSPSEHVFLKSPDSFNSFLFAREKADIKLKNEDARLEAEGKQPQQWKEADGRDVEINKTAADELRRAYDEVNSTEYRSRSDEDLMDDAELNALQEEDMIPLAPTGKIGRAMDYLEANPKALAGATLGTGALAALASDEGTPLSDRALNTGAAMLAVGLGPKARAFTKGTPLNRITANIKAQVARGLEVDAATAKAWEANVQGVVDDLDIAIEKIVKSKTSSIPRETVGLAFTDFLEGGMLKRTQYVQNREVYINDELLDIAKRYRKVLDEIGDAAIESGLIKDKSKFTRFKFGDRNNLGTGAFLANYVPHIFKRVDELPEEALMRIYGRINDMRTKDRTIKGTLAEIKKMIDEEEFDDIDGWGRYVSLTTNKPWGIGSRGVLETDPAKLISIYTQGMTRAIVGRNAIESMRRIDMAPNGKKPKGYENWDGFWTKGTEEFQRYSSRKTMPAVLLKKDFKKFQESGNYSKQELLHYKEFRHPALGAYMGHNNVMGILDDFFAISKKEGLIAIPEKLLKVNNGLKRIFVFGSLFHSQALLMSAMYALGPIGAIKGALPKSLGGARGKTGTVEWLKLQLGTESFYNIAQEAIKDGLQVVNIKKQELVNPGKPNVDPLLEKLGASGQLGKKGFDMIDKVTWEYLHDRFKLATYIRHKERAMKRGLSEKAAGRKAATFANDAFGSLDFNDFSAKLLEDAAANPNRWVGKMKDYVGSSMPVNKRRWLNMFLFAPDWTISNIRIIGKTFTGAPAASRAFYQKMVKGENWDDPKAKEILAAWQMYGGYTARAGIYTSALWWAVTSAFSNEKPTVDGLWDFWFGEQSGKLDLGDGESMVISKQIAEPIHFIQHFQHTLSNKGAIVPKTILEAMYNKQWFSMKDGLPLGPRIIDEDGTSHVGKWLFGKTLPISVKPLVQSLTTDDFDIYEGIERTLTGFLGFPQYGKPKERPYLK